MTTNTIPQAIENFKATERAELVKEAATAARYLNNLARQLAKAAESGNLHDIAWQIGTAVTQLGTCVALKRGLEDLARYENLADALRGKEG